jgi:outer membrane protein TolC
LGIKLSRDILALDLELAQNDRRPALDLTLGPGFDLGQDTIGAPFKAGIFYSIPLRQNTADGRITAVNLKLRKLELEENQTRQLVRLEVKDAVSAVNQTTLRVIAAMQEVEATKALERGETIRFREGNSTLFLINQRERGRAEAQVRLVDTRVELEQARVSYLAATTELAPNFTNPK